MKKTTSFFIFFFFLTLSAYLLIPFEAKCDTIEYQQVYSDEYQHFHQTTNTYYNGSTYNFSNLTFMMILNKPNQSIGGYPISNPQLVDSILSSYVSDTSLESTYFSFHVEIKQNLGTINESWYQLRKRPPPFAIEFHNIVVNNSEISHEISFDYLNLNVTTGYSSNVYIRAHFLLYCNYSYSIESTIVTTFIDKLVYFIPLFLILFIVPIALYSEFGKTGFAISLLLMTILAIVSSLISLSFGIVLIITESIITFIIIKKERGNG